MMMTVAHPLLASALALLLTPRPALAAAGSRPLFGNPTGNATLPSTDGTAVLVMPYCVFCPGGVPDPDLATSYRNGTSCSAAVTLSSTLGEGDVACAEIRELRGACCPAEPASAGAVIPMEDLYALFADDKNGRGKRQSILRGVSAIVSVIASSLILWMIKKSSDGPGTTFHRILLGMSGSDILFSLSCMDFGIMSPSDMDYEVWNARGNQASCSALGFMYIAGAFCGLLYSCSLNLYYLSKVKCNWTDTYLRTRIEPFLHGIPILTALVFGIVGLINKNYNVGGTGACTSPTYNPLHCIGYEDGEVREGFTIPCGQGKGAAFAFLSVLIVIFATPIIILVSLGMMYKALKDRERAGRRYGAGSLNTNNQENDDEADDEETGRSSRVVRSMSSTISSVRGSFSHGSSSDSAQDFMRRSVLHRALAYSASCILTWIWGIAVVILAFAGREAPFALAYAWAIMTPLQGMFNFLIYIQPKAAKARRAAGGSISRRRAFATAFRSGVTGEGARRP